MNEEEIIKNIKEALNKVDKDYYQVRFLNKNGHIKKAYRERVFCYELYHLMRNLDFLEEDFVINAEIDKSGNNNFKSKINPDFIIHQQGDNENNFCTIEVKLSLDLNGINKDFCSLTEMLNEHNYKQAIFILINHSLNEFAELKERYNRTCYNKNIIILCKKSPKSEVEQKTLGEILC